jgi:hypothetical protein
VVVAPGEIEEVVAAAAEREVSATGEVEFSG